MSPPGVTAGPGSTSRIEYVFDQYVPPFTGTRRPTRRESPGFRHALVVDRGRDPSPSRREGGPSPSDSDAETSALRNSPGISFLPISRTLAVVPSGPLSARTDFRDDRPDLVVHLFHGRIAHVTETSRKITFTS
ncbi:hypothetical protein GCM10017559_46630 [Streptosporangium longisporum]|uniref:Uncharacterized protein n=1 Tax=Streptosporangium longisporum TaxID=46187 RepID=A0ABN3YAL9_9ACTN